MNEQALDCIHSNQRRQRSVARSWALDLKEAGISVNVVRQDQFRHQVWMLDGGFDQF